MTDHTRTATYTVLCKHIIPQEIGTLDDRLPTRVAIHFYATKIQTSVTVCFALTDAFYISDYIASHDKMINEHQISSYVEGSDHDLTRGTKPHFTGGA